MFLVKRVRSLAAQWSGLSTPARIAATLCLAVTIGGNGITVVQNTMLRQDLVIEVRLIDAAAECYVPFQQRSFEPQFGGDFCGFIFTAQGTFKLPETRLWHVISAPREALHRKLEQGCRYDVTVVHAGGLAKEIKRINRKLGCEKTVAA